MGATKNLLIVGGITLVGVGAYLYFKPKATDTMGIGTGTGTGTGTGGGTIEAGGARLRGGGGV